jgi:hypothetical protein
MAALLLVSAPAASASPAPADVVVAAKAKAKKAKKAKRCKSGYKRVNGKCKRVRRAASNVAPPASAPVADGLSKPGCDDGRDAIARAPDGAVVCEDGSAPFCVDGGSVGADRAGAPVCAGSQDAIDPGEGVDPTAAGNDSSLLAGGYVGEGRRKADQR